jgi:hypothetical protein
LEKIYHLWDALLLQPNTLPLFIGTAIMQQLKQHFMPLDFNSAILFFSNLPVIDIDQAIADSLVLFSRTPLSILIAKYRRGDKEPPDDSEYKPSPAEEALPLQRLRQEVAPRITVADLQSFRGEKDSTMAWVDIRDPAEFAEINYPGSVNLNLKATTLNHLERLRGKHIVIIGNRGDSGAWKV